MGREMEKWKASLLDGRRKERRIAFRLRRLPYRGVKDKTGTVPSLWFDSPSAYRC